MYACEVPGHENRYGCASHTHSRIILWYADSCYLYSNHSRCTPWTRLSRSFQLCGQPCTETYTSHQHDAPPIYNEILHIYVEWRVACRPYLPCTGWYPGEQSQSTDFSIGCANGDVQLM